MTRAPGIRLPLVASDTTEVAVTRIRLVPGVSTISPAVHLIRDSSTSPIAPVNRLRWFSVTTSLPRWNAGN